MSDPSLFSSKELVAKLRRATDCGFFHFELFAEAADALERASAHEPALEQQPALWAHIDGVTYSREPPRFPLNWTPLYTRTTQPPGGEYERGFAAGSGDEGAYQRRITELETALRELDRAYVSTLETARERILFYGGQCDDVPTMERGDPHLRKARATLTKAVE